MAVSASEKYAELAAAGEDRPRCKCHGEPMYWNKRGNFYCAVKQRAAQARYSKGAPAKRKESQDRYNKSEKGRAAAKHHYYQLGGRETESIRRADLTIEKYEKLLAELRASVD